MHTFCLLAYKQLLITQYYKPEAHGIISGSHKYTIVSDLVSENMKDNNFSFTHG